MKPKKEQTQRSLKKLKLNNMDLTGINRTIKLMDEIELKNTPVVYEEVKPYKYGTKRKTFHFNSWINNIIFKNI